MGSLGKLSSMVKMRFSRMVDKLEDPRDSLEYSFEKQRELLIQTKRSIAEVITSKKRLEMQLHRLEISSKEYEEKAKKLVAEDRDELAESMLERKHETLAQIENMKQRIEELDVDKEHLMGAEAKLTNNLEFLRVQKEVIKAQYTAAQAHAKIGEVATGLSDDSNDIGNVIERARERTDELKAKSSAIEELVERNVVTDHLNAKTSISIGNDEISSKAKEDLLRIKKTD